MIMECLCIASYNLCGSYVEQRSKWLTRLVFSQRACRLKMLYDLLIFSNISNCILTLCKRAYTCFKYNVADVEPDRVVRAKL